MDIGVIAKRYARALLAYATEENAADTVYAEVCHFVDGYHRVEALPAVLHNPLVSAREKQEAICLAASTDASPVMRRFAALVTAHHRETLMPFIAHSFVDLYREQKGLSVGRLTTAVPVSPRLKRRLEDWVKNTAGSDKTVQIEMRTDPNLLGGFIFQIDDRRIDASVATQFEQIKKQFIEKNKRLV